MRCADGEGLGFPKENISEDPKCFLRPNKFPTGDSQMKKGEGETMYSSDKFPWRGESLGKGFPRSVPRMLLPGRISRSVPGREFPVRFQTSFHRLSARQPRPTPVRLPCNCIATRRPTPAFGQAALLQPHLSIGTKILNFWEQNLH